MNEWISYLKILLETYTVSFCVGGWHQNWFYITSTTTTTTDLVTECWVIQRVQFVGDVLANEVPEHLIEKSICLQEVGEPLSRPTQIFAALLCHNGYLKKMKHNIWLQTGKICKTRNGPVIHVLLLSERPVEDTPGCQHLSDYCDIETFMRLFIHSFIFSH